MTTEIQMSQFAETIYMQKYSKDREEVWEDTVDRAVTAVGYSHIRRHMEQMAFIPGGRYLYACGRPVHNTSNCYCYRAEDSREGWAGLIGDVSQTLMMGGGVGVNYSNLRASGTPILGTGGVASGPISLMKAIDSVGSHIRQGGSRRSALLGLLHWSHSDIPTYIKCKHRTEAERELKRKDPSFYLPLEGTNISIVFDKDFRLKYEAGDLFCRQLWKDVMVSAMTTGDPGWFFTEINGGLDLSNACSEFRSETNGDSCNLGTVFLNKIRDKDHMAEVVKHAVKFLVRGALYTNRPTEAARQAARANNRIGLGLGGIGHWLLSRGKTYAVDSELRGLLEVYAEVSEREAKKYAIKLGLNPPKNFRAIAPNGTISILAGATGGIEPLFCKAYVRRWMVGEEWKSKVVIDPLVKEFMAKGIPLNDIYDAYDIGFSQKLKFLDGIQEFVDMGISSTHNIGARGTEFNNFSWDQEYADTLAKCMDKLSGFTVYPDGAIDGQPLTRLSLEDALAAEHEEYAEENTCRGSVCGV
jgi:ribonucleoside-diphosphate reductase alpha chain